MSKTNNEILSEITPYDLIGSKNCTYLQSSVIEAIQAAREDERERIKEIVESRMVELGHDPLVKSMPFRIKELKKLLKKLT
jgi:hypothetical protein